MKCVILAAGYAVRMYPLTCNYPKSLLVVDRKPILSHLVESVREFVSDITVVTNHKFHKVLSIWSRNYPEVSLVDDKTTCDAGRLGALVDLSLAIQPGSDYIVMASDNYLDFPLDSFIRYYQEVQTSCVMYHEIEDPDRLRRTAVISVSDSVVTSFTEKPECPCSTLAVPPFYIYTADDCAKLSDVISSGCNLDNLGSFAEWLHSRSTIHAFKMPGTCIDISDLYC